MESSLSQLVSAIRLRQDLTTNAAFGMSAADAAYHVSVCDEIEEQTLVAVTVLGRSSEPAHRTALAGFLRRLGSGRRRLGSSPEPTNGSHDPGEDEACEFPTGPIR